MKTTGTKNFLVYRSSAGSGKTHTLAKEFLRIALKSDDPAYVRHILAITFTNKATGEMKERILQALAAFSGRKPLNHNALALKNDLLKLMKIDEAELTRKASGVLDHILHHYNDFSISTIDKFVLRIIRSFARDVKLPNHFEVELDENILLDEAINRTLAEVGLNEELTSLLIRYCIRQVDDEKSWNVDSALKKSGADLFKENASEFIDRNKKISIKKFNQYIGIIYAFMQGFEKYLQPLGQRAVQLLDESGIPREDLAGGKNGIGVYFLKLSKGIKIFPTPTLLKYADKEDWSKKDASTEVKYRIHSVHDQLLEIFSQILSYLDQYGDRYKTYQIILKNISAMAVLTTLNKKLADLRDEYKMVHISEFNKRISEIVKIEPAPFIYERLGEHYRHFLVDEFQDTSVLQWQNLLPLVHDGLAGAHFSMLAGDAKQAIYRWRSGDVKQFIRLPKVQGAGSNALLMEREKALEQNISEINLEYNYRSGKNIVEFNNFLFGELAQKLTPELGKVYASHTQKNILEGGYVSFEILNDMPEGEDPHLVRCFEIYHELLEDGHNTGEIAILCRTNDECSEIATYLMQHDIPVVSADSLKLSSSGKVNCTILVLKSLLNPDDTELNCAAILLLLKEHVIQVDLHTTLLKYCNDEADLSVSNLLEENGILINKKELLAMPLTDLLESLARVLGFMQSADTFILTMLECAHDYCQHINFGLAAFLEQWDDKYSVKNITLPKTGDAVRVMTIHKAKGLGFPAVIIPYASWKKRKGKDRKWLAYKDKYLAGLKSIVVGLNDDLKETPYAKDMEEEKDMTYLDNINLLYVACTRPSEKLYILSDIPGKSELGKDFIPIIEKHHDWNPETQKLETGARKKSKNGGKIKALPAEIASMPSASWKGRINFVKGRGEGISYQRGISLDYGMLVHQTLSLIHTIEDVDDVMAMMRKEATANTELIEKTEKTIRKMMENKSIKYFFRKGVGVFNEKELLLPGSSNILRPDRIVMERDHTEVVDFKTGQTDEKHIEQVRNYAKALRNAGCPDVEAYLIYTESMNVIQV